MIIGVRGMCDIDLFKFKWRQVSHQLHHCWRLALPPNFHLYTTLDRRWIVPSGYELQELFFRLYPMCALKMIQFNARCFVDCIVVGADVETQGLRKDSLVILHPSFVQLVGHDHQIGIDHQAPPFLIWIALGDPPKFADPRQISRTHPPCFLPYLQVGWADWPEILQKGTAWPSLSNWQDQLSSLEKSEATLKKSWPIKVNYQLCSHT